MPFAFHDDVWNCTDQQKARILEIAAERRLDPRAIEALAKEGFRAPVKALDQVQASGFIDELLSGQGKNDGYLCCLKMSSR